MPIYPTDRTFWKIRAKTIAYKRHLAFAVAAIHSAHATGPFVVSWSTGKDSTAMCHLVRLLYPDTPIMIQFDDCDWPEKRPYAERVAKAQGWEFHEVRPDFSVWEAASKCSIGFDELCSQSHSLTQDSFLRVLDAERERLSCIGSYIGLRAAESRARRLNLCMRGELYQCANGIWKCCPLARWETDDVFAYLLDHGVEINPCYFHNSIHRPQDVRLSWALPTPNGMRRGEMEQFRRHFPAQYQRLRELGVRS